MKLSFLDKLKGKNAGDSALPPPPSPQGGYGGYATQSSALAKEQKLVGYANELFSRGYSEAQVVDALRREGLNFDEIDRIISSSLKMRVSGEPVMPAEQQPYQQPMTYQPSGPEGPDYVYEEDNDIDLTPIGQGTGDILASEKPQSIDMDEIEGFIEMTVEEKMREMDEIINQFANKIEELERKMNAVSASVEDDISRIKDKTDAMEAELREMKDTFSKIEPRLSSLEKAFKDIVPNLVDSVREVKEMVHDLEMRTKSSITNETEETDLFHSTHKKDNDKKH